jgi:glycosyltransferase involved in cell wall biosynthesis
VRLGQTWAVKIAIVADLRSFNTAYRAFPLAELIDRGHEVLIDGEGARADVEQLMRFDVVHVAREYGGPMQRLVERLMRAGVAVVWDNDDWFAEPDGAPDRRRSGGMREQQHVAGTAFMVRHADVVTTTTPALAELYRGMGAACVHVVENYLPRGFTTRAAAPHDGVVVGWVAGDEHLHDARALGIADALREVLDRDPRLRARTIGVDLGLPRDRYERTRIVQYDRLGSEIAQFDVAIAPLDDVVFNRARSNVKLKEYAFCGVPWLASPIGPYAGMGEKQGGRLVPDGGWADAIARLAGSERDRRKLAKKGRKWGEGQVAARNLRPWEAALAEAVERARRRRAAPSG